MELVIGGRSQGKLKLALREHPGYEILDGKSADLPVTGKGRFLILNHTHILIRRMLDAGDSQEQIEEALLLLESQCADLILVSDEIGCGIVPMDPSERRWRETAGRVITAMAASCSRVERAFCGIAQVLKEESGKEYRAILFRHGSTPGNEERRYIGRTDEALSPAGIRQMEQLRDAEIYAGADLVFSSPLKRCLQSAEIVCPGLSPIIIENFREIDFGDYEGKNAQELLADPLSGYQAWIDSKGTMTFPHGEPRQDFIARSRQGFEEMIRIAEERQKQDTILIAAVHGGTIMSILSGLFGGDYYDYMTPNGGGYLLTAERKGGILRGTGMQKIPQEMT